MSIKILNNNNTDENNNTLKMGLNTDPEKHFDKRDCINGLFFSDLYETISNIKPDSKLAFISIPRDTLFADCHNKTKVDKMIVDRIIDIKDWDRWNDEQFCLKALQKNPEVFKFIKTPSEIVCFQAVIQDGDLLKYIDNPSEIVSLEAVKRSPYSLQYVENQNENICFEAVKRNGYALQYVKNQTDRVCLEAVRQNKDAFRFVKSASGAVITEANYQNELEKKARNERCSVM